MARYEEWIERAKSSLKISTIAVNSGVYYEDLCYQSQLSLLLLYL